MRNRHIERVENRPKIFLHTFDTAFNHFALYLLRSLSTDRTILRANVRNIRRGYELFNIMNSSSSWKRDDNETTETIAEWDEMYRYIHVYIHPESTYTTRYNFSQARYYTMKRSSYKWGKNKGLGGVHKRSRNTRRHIGWLVGAWLRVVVVGGGQVERVEMVRACARDAGCCKNRELKMLLASLRRGSRVYIEFSGVNFFTFFYSLYYTYYT